MQCVLCGRVHTNSNIESYQDTWIPYYYDIEEETEKGPVCPNCIVFLRFDDEHGDYTLKEWYRTVAIVA